MLEWVYNFYFFYIMNKKIIVLVVALFLCFLVIGGGAIFAYVWFSSAPQRALDASQKSLTEANSVAYEFEMTMPITVEASGMSLGMEMSMTGSGVVDIKNQKMSFEGEMVMPSFTGEEEEPLAVKVIYGGGKIYTYNEDEREWLSIDFEQLQNMVTTPSVTPEVALPTLNYGAIDELKFDYVGDDTVDSKTTYLYRASMNVDQINDVLDDYIQALIAQRLDTYEDAGGSFGLGNIDPEDITVTVDEMVYEYMVYKDNNLPAEFKLITSMTFDMGSTFAFSVEDMEFVITLTDYNEPVTVTIPADATEVDLTDLGNSSEIDMYDYGSDSFLEL